MAKDKTPPAQQTTYDPKNGTVTKSGKVVTNERINYTEEFKTEEEAEEAFLYQQGNSQNQ